MEKNILNKQHNYTIAVLDDEPDILELVSIQLKKSNYKVKEFQAADDFFTYLETEIPDLLILDLMLPDTDGIEICKFIKSKKEYYYIPIIMLTAKGEESDKIIGLELGADDYISKPFSPKELAARVKAVLRRTSLEKSIPEKTDIINIDDRVKIDLIAYEVIVDGDKKELTLTEFKILKLFAENRNQVFSRKDMLQYLWGEDKYVIQRTIDVHIKHLREKLGSFGKKIRNIRGVGYKLEN